LSKRISEAIKGKYGFGCFIFKVWGSEHMMAGLPDLIGCLHGRFFALEVKHPETRGDTSRRQEFVHGLIRGAGGLCEVVTSPAEALSLLNDLYSDEEARPHNRRKRSNPDA
jgi:hypothetical protein